MSEYVVIGPLSPLSKATAAMTVVTTLLSFVIMIPYLKKHSLVYDYPNMFIPFIGLCGFLLNIGFWIGMMFDYNPIRYPGSLCMAQWFFLGTFGVTALLMLFFYIIGIYEIVVLGKNGKHLAWKQKYVLIFCLICAIVFELLIPLGFPYANGEVFGVSGPWCAIRSLLVLTVLFYTPCVPSAIAIIYMAAHIAYKVRVTTSAAEKMIHVTSSSFPQGSSKASEQQKHRMEQKARLNKFYARISLFALIYAATNIGSFIKRVIELNNLPWYDPEVPNNPNMGLSILLPLLACLQGFIFASTPAITRFWGKELPAALAGRKVGTQTEDADTTRDGKVKHRSMTDLATKMAVRSDIEPASVSPNT